MSASAQAHHDGPPADYLSESTVKSWLLTVDHKRIGILYLISVTTFFRDPDAFAALNRQVIPQLVEHAGSGRQSCMDAPNDARGFLKVWREVRCCRVSGLMMRLFTRRGPVWRSADRVQRDCQDFRVRSGIMGEKESHDDPTQGAGDTG